MTRTAIPAHILHGVPPHLRNAAAVLYWRHFRAQILPLPTRSRQGVALIRALMQPDHALVALSPAGRLVGIAGLRDARGGFLKSDIGGFVDVWGPRHGRTYHLLTALCRPGGETADLVLDGLAIHPAWRRHGLARALVDAAGQHARARGHAALRAEVEAGNRDGLAAWQAMGFQPVARQRLGWPWRPPARVLRLAL